MSGAGKYMGIAWQRWADKYQGMTSDERFTAGMLALAGPCVRPVLSRRLFDSVQGGHSALLLAHISEWPLSESDANRHGWKK